MSQKLKVMLLKSGNPEKIQENFLRNPGLQDFIQTSVTELNLCDTNKTVVELQLEKPKTGKRNFRFSSEVLISPQSV